SDELLACTQASAGVVVNEYEWELLRARIGLPVQELTQRIPMVIVTEGERGVTVYTASEPLRLKACKPDRVVNPTGAGDAFRAGVLTGISKGWPLVSSLQLGQAVASFVVEQEGTLLDTLDLDEMRNRVE